MLSVGATKQVHLIEEQEELGANQLQLTPAHSETRLLYQHPPLKLYQVLGLFMSC